MEQWEDDLRAVVEHRGHALLEHADDLLEPATSPSVAVVFDEGPERDGPEERADLDTAGADPALELTVDALVAAFRRHSRRAGGGSHGTVQLVTDEELDLLQDAVQREQGRLAPGRPAPSSDPRPRDPLAPEPPDGGAPPALAAHLPEVVAQVRAGRRRGRRRALVAAGAGAVVLALAASAITGWPWDRGSPSPTSPTAPAAYAGACGSALPTGPSLLPVSLNAEPSPDDPILPDSPWYASYRSDPSALTGDDLATLSSVRPGVVLVRGGHVVALGTDHGVVLQDGDGTSSTSLPLVSRAGSPEPGGLTVGAASNDIGVTFVSCDAGVVEPGSYRAYLFGTTPDGSAHVLSDPAAVTVLAPTPDGDQPSWLAGSALACGESMNEFLIRITTHPFIDLHQSGAYVHDDGIDYRFENDAGTTPTLILPRLAALAWVQHGRIVGVGPDERGTEPTRIPPGKKVTLSARPWNTTDYCATSERTRPRLPAGTYQVFGYARVPSQDPHNQDSWFVETSGPASVKIAADGSVTLG